MNDVGFLINPTPNSSSCTIPNAHISAVILCTPFKFKISCTCHALQLVAEAGCSCKKYAPLSMSFLYRRQHHRRWSRPRIRFRSTSSGLLRPLLKFWMLENGVQLGLPIRSIGFLQSSFPAAFFLLLICSSQLGCFAIAMPRYTILLFT